MLPSVSDGVDPASGLVPPAKPGVPLRTVCSTLLFLVTTLYLYSAHAQASGTDFSTALSQAVTTSSSAKAARFERDAAIARAERDRPVARPTIFANASGGVQGPRVNLPGMSPLTETVLPSETGRVDLILEQQLYHPGVPAARVRFRAELALADIAYRKALASISLNVENLYLDLYKAQVGVKMATEGVVAANSYCKLVDETIASGVGKPVDRSSAAARLAEAQSVLISAQSGVALAGMALNRAVGKPLSSANVETVLSLPKDVDGSELERAVAAARNRRAEVLEAVVGLSAARAGVKLAASQSGPSVVARGQLTEQTPTALIHEHYASATIEIHIPILDAQKTRIDTREAVAEVNRLQEMLQEAKSGVELDVQRAWRKIADARSKIELSRARSLGSQATLTVAEAAYKAGRASAFELESAQREKRLSAESAIQAEVDLMAAYIDFKYAQGDAPETVQRAAPILNYSESW